MSELSSYDLHTHSTASDGRSTPTQLVREAAAAGLTAIALTDHDSYDGLDEARAAGVEAGVRVLAGMELSTLSGRTSVHVLAYGDLRGDRDLAGMLRRTLASRVDRVQDMARRIAAGEVGIDEVDLLAALHRHTPAGATQGRPHLADALISLGVVPDRDAAFVRLLSEHGPYYAPYRAPDTAVAIAAVRRAGGIPVLAHPWSRSGGDVLSSAQIADLLGAGLAGLEVDHRDHDDQDRFGLRILAKDLGMVVTGSSDYHGLGKSNALGENTTDPAVVAEIEQLLTVAW